MKKLFIIFIISLILLLSGLTYYAVAFRDSKSCRASCKTIFDGCRTFCTSSWKNDESFRDQCLDTCSNDYEHCIEDCESEDKPSKTKREDY